MANPHNKHMAEGARARVGGGAARARPPTPHPTPHPPQDDLLCLPPKLAQSLGGLGPLVLVTRVTSGVTLTDPVTLREAVLDATAFWRQPLRPLLSARNLVEYVVLDAEPVGGAGGATRRHALADVTLARKADFGVNDHTICVRSHLGALLRAGDDAVGYDLATAAPSDPALDAALGRGLAPPDALLVRKSYEERRRKRKAKGERRPWVLKRMDMVGGDDPAAADAPAARARGRAAGAPTDDGADMERFMQELEEDPDLRARVALFRDPAAAAAAGAPPRGVAPMADDGSSSDGDVPEVPLEELLEDLEGLDIDDE